MRRFNVHLVTEVDFLDGDEASDQAARDYEKHLTEAIPIAALGSRPAPSGAPGSKASRSQNSRMSSKAERS